MSKATDHIDKTLAQNGAQHTSENATPRALGAMQAENAGLVASAGHLSRLVDSLRRALEKILEEPKTTLSDGKALAAIVRIAKRALAPLAPTAPPDRDDMGRLVVEASGGEAVPDSVWEALQRMIEDGLVKGSASQEDARIVMQYRDRVRFLATPAPSPLAETPKAKPHREWYSALTTAAETLETECEHRSEGGHDADATKMRRAAKIIRTSLTAAQPADGKGEAALRADPRVVTLRYSTKDGRLLRADEPDDGPGTRVTYELAQLIKERDAWQDRAKWLQRDLHLTQCDNTLMRAKLEKDVWVWQGDGSDFLHSMGDRMAVVIFARDLRTAIGVKQQGAEAERLLVSVRAFIEHNIPGQLTKEAAYSLLDLAIDEARGLAAGEFVQMVKEDANAFSRILALLGLDEEGDPVAEVQKLLDQADAHFNSK